MTFIVVAIFALLCFFLTAFMPWAELGLPQAGPLAGFHHMVMDVFKHVANQKGMEYYVYAAVLGLAMTCAAIAINAVGRQDAEEKLILPEKK